jgi:ribosomal protein L11 methyltransferase
MTEQAVQIIARGPRAVAEAAAASLDSDPLLEGATYSILEEDEDKGIWRIDAFPNDADDAAGSRRAEGARRPDREGREAGRRRLAGHVAVGPAARARRPVLRLWRPRQGIVPNNTVNLKIDAGAAFGTGHHGTTVGCLIAFDELLKSRSGSSACSTSAAARACWPSPRPRPDRRSPSAPTSTSPSVRIANENAKLNMADARFVHAFGPERPQGAPARAL